MPALNYHSCFSARVQSGEKLQTIRAQRKVTIKPGDTLYHFTGMRTKACRRLGVSICKDALNIDIIRTEQVKAVFLQMCNGGSQRRIGNAEILAIATADGFADVDSFWTWFTGDATTKPRHFHGQLIKWPEINAESEALT